MILSVPGAESLPSRGIGPAVSAASPPAQPQLDRQTLTPIAAAEIGERRDVAAVARRMPIQLIAPLAASSGVEMDKAWGLDAVGALTSQFTGEGATVAILDTGIDRNHPAFTGVNIVEQDFTGSGNGDTHGHGTHCAGTILGRNVNGVRIGVAPGVTNLLVGKVIGAQNGDSTMLFDAIDWAIRQGADVISMSLGFDFPGYVARRILVENMPIQAAVADGLEAYRTNLRMLDAIIEMSNVGGAYDRDPIVIAAAGNESRRPAYTVPTSIPGAVLDVVSVAALQRDGAGGHGIASFSNTVPQLAAPGVDILSAEHRTGGLVAMSGTSMACPHVAGVAALWWQALRSQGRRHGGVDIMAQLFATAHFAGIASGTTGDDVGRGMVKAP
jgi:subtilisin family serine protease